MKHRSRVRIGRLLGISAAIVALTVTSASASPSSNGGGGRQNDAGDEAAELMISTQQRDAARTAPTGLVDPGAYAAAYAQYSSLGQAPGSWSQVTNTPYNSDDPGYRDPSASNSSGGAGYVSGRVQAVVADANCLFAGGAMSGVSRSCDNGATWTPIADALPTQSIGSMSLDPDGALWIATGDGTTGSGTYVGAGVYRLASPDSSAFTASTAPTAKIGGTELDSQVIRRILIDATGKRVYVAGSRGLYAHSLTPSTTPWTRVLAPCATTPASCADVNPNYWDITNDVVVQPGTGGKTIVANVAWRSGAAYNGFYRSTDGAKSWTKINPGGAINPKDVGNATMQYSADGSRLYVVLESPAALNAGKASALSGVYVSPSGDASGPYNQIANPSVLAQSGSAERKQSIGAGYQPGVQAWYNQFVGVDPNNAQHVYVGLEEVYESWNGGATWSAIGRYWNFGLSCWSYIDSQNTCDGNVVHSDQHTITFRPGTKESAGTVFVGNDGGLYSRSMSPSASSWTSLTASGNLNFLQYYSVAVGKSTSKTSPGMQVWGGLQDNGVSLLDPANGGTMVSPYGGDGGGQLADQNDGCRTVGEYVYLTLQMTTKCGVADGSAASDTSIVSIAPNDPNPRFTAPFGADQTDPNTWVAGGEYVWVNTKTWASTSGADWSNVADSGPGHSITAIASRNHTVWAGWCGGCNPGSSFGRGLLTNAGGSYQPVDLPSDVPNRMITGVTPDPADAHSAYVVFGGYSRTWTDGPGNLAAGVGHVWKVTVTGGTTPTTTWKDVSGNLPDVPADNMLITTTGRVLLGTDLGMVETTLTGLHSGSPTWKRTNLPVTVVSQVIEGPDANLYAATFGRGIYRTSAAVSKK
jgi:hypothetical protein